MRTVQHFQLCDFIIGEYCYTSLIHIRAALTENCLKVYFKLKTKNK